MAKQKFSDLDLIAALNAHEGNESAAARELGVTPAAITKRRKLLPDGVLSKNLKDYRQRRADIFAGFQRALIAGITPDKINKASLQQIGTLFGIFYDKERLEQNLATEHIAHAMQKKLDPKDLESLKRYIDESTARKVNAVEYDDGAERVGDSTPAPTLASEAEEDL
jgi:hypothetical protein